MTSILNKIELKKVIWAIPVVFLLHEMEEWNILEWYHRFYRDLPPMTNLSIRLWLILISVFAFFIVWLSTRFKNEKITVLLLIPFVSLIIANGFEHFFWLIYFKSYAPGVIFAAFIGIPLCIYFIYCAVSEMRVPIWYVLIFTCIVIYIIISTIISRNTLTPFIRSLHNLSLLLADEILK